MLTADHPRTSTRLAQVFVLVKSCPLAIYAYQSAKRINRSSSRRRTDTDQEKKERKISKPTTRLYTPTGAFTRLPSPRYYSTDERRTTERAHSSHTAVLVL
ncbi:hypothetical protein RRG08_025827 [Elysia crispata]|uniref:Uncharacterized protein n=1 Tax=Elysia crispata TaxID=231223 RepID=A0AAE0Y358_9GAST|nr:hypothetical protein RRG08_025827 [Elysia crispata]